MTTKTAENTSADGAIRRPPPVFKKRSVGNAAKSAMIAGCMIRY
jgi:hypothetical protein